MPSVHVLTNAGGQNYSFITHIAVPAGNNAVGTSWKICWLASFGTSSPKSTLMVGNGAGQISQTEAAQILSGDLLEFGPFQFTDDSTLTAATRNAMIDAIAMQLTNQALSDFRDQFRYYG